MYAGEVPGLRLDELRDNRLGFVERVLPGPPVRAESIIACTRTSGVFILVPFSKFLLRKLCTCAEMLIAVVAVGGFLLVWQTPAFSRQSPEHSDASNSESPSAGTDKIQVLPVPVPEKSPPISPNVPEFKIPIFVSCPLTDLQQTVPELGALKPSTDQTELPTLLIHVGAKILEIASRTPNLSSHETVATKYGASSARRQFSYLVLPQPHPGGMIAFDEFRLDLASEKKLQTEDIQRAPVSRPQPSGTSFVDLRSLLKQLKQLPGLEPGGFPLAQGFANMWLYFEPLNQPESSFRYPGQEHMSGHRTLVLAFSQKPESVRSPAEFRFEDKTLPIFMQGVAWVDASTFQILRLRTDLLLPIETLGVRQLTANIEFAQTLIATLNLPLWLPRQVSVTWNFNGQIIREKHHYTKYRLFRARSKILLNR